MEQRLSIITLGVSNLKDSESFYSDKLGWQKLKSSNDQIVFYGLNGFQLALYSIDKLAEDATVDLQELDFRGLTLAYNTRTQEEVDLLFQSLIEKGVNVIKHPVETFWGGYSGYFSDPDGNLWAVAYNPFLKLDRFGNTINHASIEIDISNEKDLEEILTLQKEAYVQEAEIYNDFAIPPLKQTIESLIEEWQQGIILKATAQGEIVGSVRAKLVDKVCHIGKLIVKPDSQNRGIGKLMMKEIERIFDNAERYELFTGDRSEKNLGLYRKLGYKDFESERIDDKMSLIYLQKHRIPLPNSGSNLNSGLEVCKGFPIFKLY